MAILQESIKFNNAEQHPSICAIEIAFTCFGLAAGRYCAQMRPVCDTIKIVIDSHGADFPDKV